MAPSTAPASSRPKAELAAGLAAIVFGLALIAVVPQLRHCVGLVVDGHFTQFRGYIRSLGAGGIALLVGLMVVHGIVWYPSEIVTATAGYVYGFGPALALAAGGWLLAALLSYALGRTVGRPLLRRLLGQRFESLASAIDRGGIPLLLGGRLIPIVPFALMGYAAGAVHANLWRFSWTTVLGYLPLTAAVAFLGSRAQSLSTSNPILWLAAAALIGLVTIEETIRHRSKRGHSPMAHPGVPDYRTSSREQCPDRR